MSDLIATVGFPCHSGATLPILYAPENPIAKNIIAGKHLPGAEIEVTAKNGAIVV